ncbi:MAG: hypothetical protein HQ581_09260 [Planctomycetes bacterium]|nr:hypothetical protein [Planctomycetota bacterium]
MKHDLKDLYGRFNAYMARLEVDVQAATQDLPRRTRRAFCVPRQSFAEFEVFWTHLQRNPELLDRWTRRLRPGGYESQFRAIFAELQRYQQDTPAQPGRPAEDRRGAA